MGELEILWMASYSDKFQNELSRVVSVDRMGTSYEYRPTPARYMRIM